jgi:phage terminase small subunit
MTSTALTVKQARFCDEYVVCGNAAAAARAAGYRERSARQIGFENLTKHDIKAAIQARQQALAVRLELDRATVIAAILGAIKAAQEQGNQAVMVRGYVEIARMLDFYNPETLKAEQERRSGADVRNMSAADLCKRMNEGGKYRNPDGSRMHPAQLEAFYEGVTDDELEALSEGRAVVETRVVMLADASGQPADNAMEP